MGIWQRCGASLLSVFLLVSATGCLLLPWGRIYSGDGRYETTPGMHQIRLGIISLAQPGSQDFTLRRMGPGWQWNIGFRVEPHRSPPDLEASFLPKAVVRLTLTNERHERVFSEEGRLSDWRWNRNHAWQTGKGEDYQVSPGNYSFRRFDAGPDDGWGTTFTPRASGVYTLRCEVLEPSPIPPETDVWLVAETYWAGP